MGEARKPMLIAPDSCYPDAVARAFAVADGSREPVQAGIEAVVAMSEVDPKGARVALWRLLADWPTLVQLEERLGESSAQAALRIGAAIQVARSELSSPAPQLRRRLPEMLEWLGRAA